MGTMWMIRSDGGSLYEEFRERGIAAIGWNQLAPHAKVGMTRKELTDLYRSLEPATKEKTAISGASQVWRFMNEIKTGDLVVTYSPANRTYLIGRVTGDCEYRADLAEAEMSLVRTVAWNDKEVERDSLTDVTKNSLGSTLTVFVIAGFAMQELLGEATGKPMQPAPEIPEDQVEADPLSGMQALALERIKDIISKLDWAEMQELVAGILRAMGYKTQVSPAGSDRGKDIIASPDGFGFEHPRIIVEVKHRKGQMGTSHIRSFLGGRHPDDRGLFVSTGGFSKEAYYEADRASVPLTLWTSDHVVRALSDHYEDTDAETKRLVPLKRTYLPA
ncbi:MULTISPECIES: restriction endonuclease [unclassified Caballeronia]|uniref:restriction endonuclease n=1 Tax=unclassified Caballeronia TaxID=2646786 RepID=UPI001F361070|nr:MULTISPECIES: restriction endonuclease [unclassified Caballeronia]MCE4543255.1 restriction endonuclease [Caballeronia sp. PC1]MCE4567689.1 restriction endonuclease [Caballeronia sp. CLC5]